MDANWMIPAFIMIDTLMEHLEHQSDLRAQVPDSEIVTVAVVRSAEKDYTFRNILEVAVWSNAHSM